MPLIRADLGAFVEALEQAEDAVGYPPAILLKDYWLCAVLRELRKLFPGEFLLKGGTSLSKGWGLIERMSEDIDVLVMEEADDSASKREDRLRGMTEAVAKELGLKWNEHSSPGRGARAHRRDIIAYDTLNLTGGGIDTAGVLLETGFGHGWEPKELITVTPLLASVDAAQFDDLASFKIPALMPVRTLIEKLHALHSAVDEFTKTGAIADDRIARHYYDIYCCLEHLPTLDILKKERPHVTSLFKDVARISDEHFGSKATRPESGYASSDAFQPGFKNALRDKLEAAYSRAKELMHIEAAEKGKWPKFGEVLKRIAENADHL